LLGLGTGSSSNGGSGSAAPALWGGRGGRSRCRCLSAAQPAEAAKQPRLGRGQQTLLTGGGGTSWVSRAPTSALPCRLAVLNAPSSLRLTVPKRVLGHHTTSAAPAATTSWSGRGPLLTLAERVLWRCPENSVAVHLAAVVAAATPVPTPLVEKGLGGRCTSVWP